MIKFVKSLQAFGTEKFNEILKQDIESINPDLLPLQEALTVSSYAVSNNIKSIILSVTDNTQTIFAKAGIFYSGIIMGCNCADDPTPVEEQPEYCEVVFSINKATAETTVQLAPD